MVTPETTFTSRLYMVPSGSMGALNWAPVIHKGMSLSYGWSKSSSPHSDLNRSASGNETSGIASVRSERTTAGKAYDFRRQGSLASGC